MDGLRPPGARAAPGLSIAAAAAVVLAAIALRLHGADLPLFVAVNGWRGMPDLAWELLTVAGLGSSVLVIGLLLARGRPEPIATLAWALAVGASCGQVLKRLCDLPRPAAVLEATSVHVAGPLLLAHGMPSGHAIAAASLAGVLWLAGGPAFRRPLVTALLVLFAGAVALSRVEVGAHFPTDVAAGLAVGWAAAVAGAALARVTGTAAWLARPVGRWAAALAQVGAGAALALADTGHPRAAPLQFVLAGCAVVGPGRWMVSRVGPATAVRVRRVARAAAVAIGSAGGLALLAWLLREVDLRRLPEAVRPAGAGAWAVAAAGLLASYGFRALRIRAELRARRPVTFGACLEVMLLHNAAVNVLPMRGGELAYPWLLHRRLGVPVGEAVASLAWFRVQDGVVLAAVALALWPGLPFAARAGGAALLVAGTAALLRALASTPAGREGGEAAPPGRLARLRRAREALALAPRHGTAGWVFCAASWASKLAGLGVFLSALSGLSPAAAIAGVLGGELAAVLPLQGPAGFGTYEGGVWAAVAAAVPRGAAGGVGGGGAAGVVAPVAAAAVAVHLLSLAAALLAGAGAHALARRRAAAPPAPAPEPASASAAARPPAGAGP